MENITVTSRLELFSNYADKPQNFDVNSDTRINMQVNRYISANLLLQMMYDESTRVNVFEEGVLVGTTGPTSADKTGIWPWLFIPVLK
jgi:hypothetical protein